LDPYEFVEGEFVFALVYFDKFDDALYLIDLGLA
jgi:hypothetical protein